MNKYQEKKNKKYPKNITVKAFGRIYNLEKLWTFADYYYGAYTKERAKEIRRREFLECCGSEAEMDKYIPLYESYWAGDTPFCDAERIYDEDIEIISNKDFE